jgi:hypothetical protein
MKLFVKLVRKGRRSKRFTDMRNGNFCGGIESFFEDKVFRVRLLAELRRA